MQFDKCDLDYEHGVLHLHKKKCEGCTYYSECEYVKMMREVNADGKTTDCD